MTPDIHPEELLDKVAHQALSASERALLDTHLAQCPTCRFELRARADFAFAPSASVPVDDVVTRALAGLPRAQPTRPRWRPSPRFLAVAATLTAVVGFAAVGPPKLVPRALAALGLALEPPPPRAPPQPTGAANTSPSSGEAEPPSAPVPSASSSAAEAPTAPLPSPSSTEPLPAASGSSAPSQAPRGTAPSAVLTEAPPVVHEP